MTVGAFYAAQPASARQAIYDGLRAGALDMAYLLEFDFASGPVRLCNRTVPVVDGKDGHTWTPAPRTSAIRDIGGGPDVLAPVRVYAMTIPPDLLNAFAGEAGPMPDLRSKSEYQGRTATLSLQLLQTGQGASGTDLALGYPSTLHTGQMDRVERSVTREGVTFEMHVEGFLARKGVQGAGLLTPRDQKQRFPGDLGLNYAAEVRARPAVWPDY
jgi:hypothetical protein